MTAPRQTGARLRSCGKPHAQPWELVLQYRDGGVI